MRSSCRRTTNRLLRLGVLAAALVATGLLTARCASGPAVMGDPGDFAADIAALEPVVADHPDSTAALRDLGALYVRSRQPSRAYRTLRRAAGLSADPDSAETATPTTDDPKTLFYLGLASEQTGRMGEALDLMARYDTVPRGSRYRTLMRGRYEHLVRQQLRTDLRRQVAREQRGEVGRVERQVVAVLPLAFVGGDERFAPLGQGLSELILTDLAQVRRLRLVERLRLDVLLDELELSRSEAIDNSTAPRVGRLLGAGRLVGGSFAVSSDDDFIRLNVAVAELTGEVGFPGSEQATGALDRLFALEKRIVFGLLRDLGIRPTPAERDAIERVPTRNIQAFLAFSRGLAAERAGDYVGAAQAFGQAASLDPGFQQAAEQQQAAEGLSQAGGPMGKAIASEAGLPFAQAAPVNLRQARLGQLSGAHFSPGGSREAGEEAAAAAVPVNPTIPLPGAPPTSSGGGN